jgi:hypothetical protein
MQIRHQLQVRICKENGSHTPRILALPILDLSRKERRYNNVTHGINLKSNFRNNFFSNTFCSCSDILFHLSKTSGWMLPASAPSMIPFSVPPEVSVGTFSGENGAIIGGLVESITTVDCEIVVMKIFQCCASYTCVNMTKWKPVSSFHTRKHSKFYAIGHPVPRANSNVPVLRYKLLELFHLRANKESVTPMDTREKREDRFCKRHS